MKADERIYYYLTVDWNVSLSITARLTAQHGNPDLMIKRCHTNASVSVLNDILEACRPSREEIL
jgi:hypothetical protein